MSQAGKGHVPEENLPRYRSIASIARRYEKLGNDLSNVGFYAEASKAWKDSQYYWHKANELRVDLVRS